MNGSEPTEVAVDYRALSEFHYQIRRFLRVSEQAARQAGLEPQQHQLMLAIRGLPQGGEPTVSELAERLQVRHHSVVELIDRLEQRGFVARRRAERDRRKVLVDLTAEGERMLLALNATHRMELQEAGPELVRLLSGLLVVKA
ncbi:MAG: MarR family winged helix-turn-helix transcriptional regulator [Acidobacteriota bacterium]